MVEFTLLESTSRGRRLEIGKNYNSQIWIKITWDKHTDYNLSLANDHFYDWMKCNIVQISILSDVYYPLLFVSKNKLSSDPMFFFYFTTFNDKNNNKKWDQYGQHTALEMVRHAIDMVHLRAKWSECEMVLARNDPLPFRHE